MTPKQIAKCITEDLTINNGLMEDKAARQGGPDKVLFSKGTGKFTFLIGWMGGLFWFTSDQPRTEDLHYTKFVQSVVPVNKISPENIPKFFMPEPDMEFDVETEEEIESRDEDEAAAG